MESVTNNDNMQQYCKGCEKLLTSSLFITNRKPFRTCSNCRLLNKTNYQQKLIYKQLNGSSNADFTDHMPIEIDDLNDFISKVLDEFENTTNSEKESENKENEAILTFRFSCIVNIITLEGDSRKQADDIIKAISD